MYSHNSRSHNDLTDRIYNKSWISACMKVSVHYEVLHNKYSHNDQLNHSESM